MTSKQEKAEHGESRKPLYKQWWFWVVVVVLAAALCIILTTTMTTRSHMNDERKVTAQDLMEQANDDHTDAVVKEVAIKLESYKIDHDRYPHKLEDVIADPSYLDEYDVVYDVDEDGQHFTITYSISKGRKTIVSEDD